MIPFSKVNNFYSIFEDNNHLLTKIYKNKIKRCEDTYQYSNIDYNLLNRLLETEFYNSNLMELTSCILNNTLVSYRSYKDLLKNIKDLKVDKNKQKIFIASLSDSESTLLFKIDRFSDIISEAVVGMYVGNQVRKVLPTMEWIYGLTECDFPLVHKNKILTACSQDINISSKGYVGLIVERVIGPSLLDSIGILQPNELLSILLTITITLQYAHSKFGFIHMDLHTGNILLRELSQKSSFYDPLHNNYIICDKQIATIIDYGKSILRTHDFDEFVIDFEKKYKNVYKRLNIPSSTVGFMKALKNCYGGEYGPFVTNPMIDILKLLFDVYSLCIELDVKNGCTELLEDILSEVTDNPFELMKLFENNTFYLPDHHFLDNLNIDNIYDLLVALSDDYGFKIISSEPIGFNLSCLKANCASKEEILDVLEIEDQHVKDIYTFELKERILNKPDSLEKLIEIADFINQSSYLEEDLIKEYNRIYDMTYIFDNKKFLQSLGPTTKQDKIKSILENASDIY